MTPLIWPSIFILYTIVDCHFEFVQATNQQMKIYTIPAAKWHRKSKSKKKDVENIYCSITCDSPKTHQSQLCRMVSVFDCLQPFNIQHVYTHMTNIRMMFKSIYEGCFSFPQRLCVLCVFFMWLLCCLAFSVFLCVCGSGAYGLGMRRFVFKYKIYSGVVVLYDQNHHDLHV